jgi:predicted nucleic acid-binding protein
MIVVIDSNVWLSAFLTPRGTSGRLFELVRLGLLDVVSTPKLWDELSRSAAYERVRKPLERDGVWADTQVFLATRPNIRFVPSTAPVANWVSADPDDDWVVQCAKGGTTRVFPCSLSHEHRCPVADDHRAEQGNHERCSGAVRRICRVGGCVGLQRVFHAAEHCHRSPTLRARYREHPNA